MIIGQIHTILVFREIVKGHAQPFKCCAMGGQILKTPPKFNENCLKLLHLSHKTTVR